MVLESAGNVLVVEAKTFIDCCGVIHTLRYIVQIHMYDIVAASLGGPESVKVEIQTLIYTKSFVTWHHTSMSTSICIAVNLALALWKPY